MVSKKEKTIQADTNLKFLGYSFLTTTIKEKQQATCGLAKACNVLASPINKNIFVVRLGRKYPLIRRPSPSPNVVCHNLTRYIFLVLFAMTPYNSSEQTLDKYADQLYFGMLSLNPDTSVTEFLTKYIPVIFKKFDNSGGWTVYPPGVIEEPTFYKVTHSYVFSSHPYFKGHFKSRQLAITQKIYSDEKWNGNITDIKLWFECDNEEDAKRSFKQLIDTFSSFNVLKRITSQQGIDKAEFTDKNCDKYYSNIQIFLATDYTLGKRYAMPTEKEVKIITEAGYKILVEIGNDLY